MEEFPEFGKIPRFNRNVVVTEKIDGTNGLISITRHSLGEALEYNGTLNFLPFAVIVDESEADQTGEPTHEFHIRPGSRNRWITPREDNHGFAAWVWDNSYELSKLGEGNHYGEWYGKGIESGYGLDEKRFMLFNTARWSDPAVRPTCCEVSTVLFEGNMKELTHTDYAECSCCYNGTRLDAILEDLQFGGSKHVPGFMNPEGVIIYHKASNSLFKVTLKKDDEWKGKNG